MKQLVEKSIIHAVKNVHSLSLDEVKLETPPKKELWDFAFGCFLLARECKKSPQDIAQELAKNISENIGGNIASVQAAGPYVNFFLWNESFTEDFIAMMQREKLINTEPGNKEKTIYIDYIGANVGKPLHIGHMCTPSQGQVFVNLFSKLGYEVVADSHIGDWGIIFWKLIVAYKKYGKPEKLTENAVEHLFELYVKISADAEENPDLDADFRQAFKLLSEGNSEMKELWSSFTRYSIDAMNILLNRLYVYPQYNIWESFYEWIGLSKMEDYPDLEYSMSQIVKELIEKNIATKNDDGSVWVVFSEESKLPSCILQKRDGTHGYLASDLASVKYRVTNWDISKILYFVDVRQQLHFKQVEEISRLAGWLEKNMEFTHAHNGFISLKDGAMSTRKGKIIKLESLLNEAQSRAKAVMLEKNTSMSQEELDKTAEIIWIWAIKYGYLKKTRTNDVIFDWDEFMNFEGNSGPYIAYAYVRAMKILKEQKGVLNDEVSFEKDEEKQLLKAILDFPKCLDEMQEWYYAHILCAYMYNLARAFSAVYNNVQILSEENQKLKNSRLLLLESFTRVMKESADILGIPLPGKM